MKFTNMLFCQSNYDKMYSVKVTEVNEYSIVLLTSGERSV